MMVNLCLRVGAYLAENIKDQNRIPKTVIIKKPYVVVDKVRGVLENSKNLNKKIEANHALASLSDVEKTMNSVPLQGFDI